MIFSPGDKDVLDQYHPQNGDNETRRPKTLTTTRIKCTEFCGIVNALCLCVKPSEFCM